MRAVLLTNSTDTVYCGVCDYLSTLELMAIMIKEQGSLLTCASMY